MPVVAASGLPTKSDHINKQSGEYFPQFEYSLFSMLSVTSDDSYHNPFYNNKKTIDATLQTKQTVVVRCLFNYSYKYANYSTFFV